jgi:ABC-type transport system involved in multi-copper enzyme maturation permease subunit/DNA-binding XRE family transcriptional regulator
MARWGFGPVFFLECVSAARRWQMYASRVVLLALLLSSLLIVWAALLAFGPDALSISALARVGEAFFYALVGTQLVLVILAAPAFTAGAICLDKSSGRLMHMLVTDLSAKEIVLGKLGPRLLSIFGLLLASLPILALTTLLGGIVPEAFFGAFLVTLGVAVVTCTLAMTLSVWGNHPHEVLLAAYLIAVVPILAWPAWELVPASWGLGPAPLWLQKSSPFWLAFAHYLRPSAVDFSDYLEFLGVCLGLSALLTLIAAVTLRRASRRVAIVRRRKRRRLFRWWFPSSGPLSEFTDQMIRELHRRRLPFSLRVFWVLYYILLGWWRIPRSTIKRETLDVNPVLWREWGRRPSRWIRAVWVIYFVLSFLAAVAVLSAPPSVLDGELPGFVGGLLYTLGLLLVIINAASSLFEERVRGNLDLLLTTPIPTARIVWGKWVASFRDAVLVMAVPLGMAFWLDGSVDCVMQLGLMMLVYGAAATSLGLALATWVKRLSMALAIAVMALIVSGMVPLLVQFSLHGGLFYRFDDYDYNFVSPWFGVGELIYQNHDAKILDAEWKLAWFFLYSMTAILLLIATERTYARCMGRVNQRPIKLGKEEFLRAVGVRIRNRRLTLNLTQAELAEECGLTLEYIECLERGERNPSLINLRRIARVLWIPLSELFERLS